MTLDVVGCVVVDVTGTSPRQGSRTGFNRVKSEIVRTPYLIIGVKYLLR